MNKPVKVLLGLVMAVVLVFVLFTYVFPWVDENFFADPAMEAAPFRVERSA